MLPAPAQQMSSSARNPGGRVLVVDDSEPFVALLDAFLTSELACEVVSYGEGAGVVELARRLKPGLILLDLVLPDVHGHEVCRRLAEDPDTAGIPVVLMSGMSPGDGWQARPNVLRFMAKPFQLGALADVVHHVLNVA